MTAGVIWVSSTDPVPQPSGVRGCGAGCDMGCGVDAGLAGVGLAGAGDGTPPAARTSRHVNGTCPGASGVVGTGRAGMSCGGRAIGVGVPAARAPPPPKTEDLTG